MALSPKWYQFLVGVFASLGSVLYGYDLGVIAGVISAVPFLATFNQPSAAALGAVVSVFTGGAFFGAFFAGPLGDFLGRKRTILLGALIFCLGGGLQTGAKTIAYLYAGRALAGCGVGFLVMIVPLYQAEIAHPSIRGRITSLQQFMLGIGALIASWCTYGTTKNLSPTSNTQWRLPLGIQIVPAALLAMLILLFPESPRWLIDHGRGAEGLKTLARLHAHGDETDVWVQAEYQQIQDAITFEHEHEAKGYRELFGHWPSMRRLILVCAIQASCQLTGVSAIQYFSVDIFAQMGISTSNTLKYQGINSVLALLAQFACVLFIDWTGRRWPLILGNVMNGLCFLVAAVLLDKFPPTGGQMSNVSAGWAFILMTWIYNISFSATCGPLTWVIPTEVFDTRTRSKGVSIGVMVSFAFNTLIGQITTIAIQNVGAPRYYILFIVCNFTNAIFFWAFMPETAKLPLESMNRLFTEAPLFVPTANMSQYNHHELERRVEEIASGKGEIVTEVEKY